jgi:hypothetical protein
MSGYGEQASYGGAGSYGPAQPAHVCNCIGCCRYCGTCVTLPGHTEAACKKLVELQAQMAEVLNPTLQEG